MPDIRQRISLNGADDVVSKLRKVGDTGQDALKKLKQYSGESLGKFGEHAEALEGSHEAGEKLRESLHVLHPILESAGLELGKFGAFARLAGAGLVPLGAALAGSVLIGLAKVGEEAQKSTARLKALGAGEGGFEELTQQAKALGVSVEKLEPGFQRLAAWNQKLAAKQGHVVTFAPGHEPSEAERSAANVEVIGSNGLTGPLPPEILGKGYAALLNESRTDTSDTEKAIAAIDSFLDNARESGGVTSKGLEGLRGQLPNVANFVARSSGAHFGRQFANAAEYGGFLDSTQRTVTPQQLLTDVAKNGDEAARNAAAARGVSEAFEGLEASTKRLADALSGDRGITSAIDHVAKLIDEGANSVDRLRHPEEFRPGGERFVGPVRPEDVHTAPQTLGEVFSSNQGDLMGRLVGYLRSGGEQGPNPFGVTTSFLKNAITNPAAIPEKVHPEDSTAGAQPGAVTGAIGQAAQQATADAKEQTSVLQQILSVIGAVTNKPPENPAPNGIADAIGIRGAVGGHIRGAGTSTSDSIPAMLSDGEYVVKASSVKKAGVGFLDWINAGKYADGGPAGDAGSGSALSGSGEVSYDPTTGGAYVNGVLHLPGDPLLDDPIIKRLAQQSAASMNDTSSDGRSKHHSAFIGNFGEGSGFAAGGLVGMIQHFADGGPAFDIGDFSSPLDHGSVPKFSQGDLISGSRPEHLGTVDLRTDHGDVRVGASRDTVGDLRKAAITKRITATGRAPSWVGGATG